MIPGFFVPAKTMSVDWPQIESLRQAARAAAANAYSPYGVQFAVGCALIMADDPSRQIFTGSNSENGVLNAGICAERAALHYAVGQGFRQLKLIAISTPRLGDAINFRSPCGLCRQTMAEFADANTLFIIDTNATGQLCDLLDIDRLLPHRYIFDTNN
jgi:cytidine deaminase